MLVVWSEQALGDLQEIFDYIVAESPGAALAVDSRICGQANLLGKFPMAGKEGRVAGTRELVVPRTPFVIAYSVETDAVTILRVLHGARFWPAAF